MAIDTQAKRCSAIASRRLPWFRRFAPIPDGSMTQADRQQVAFVYRGILASEAEVVVNTAIRITGRRTSITLAGKRTTITLTGRRTGEV